MMNSIVICALIGALIGAIIAILMHVAWKQIHTHEWDAEHSFNVEETIDRSARSRAELLAEYNEKELQRLLLENYDE